MIKLYITVEGQTEETFVREVLSGPLYERGILAITHLAAVNRARPPARGGWRSYDAVKKDISINMKRCSGNDFRFTTMLDLYRIPADFPGHSEGAGITAPHDRAEILEQRFQEDIGDWRFVPYIQLHEYEALLFSDIAKLSDYYTSSSDAVAELASECSSFPSPEHIDDGQDTSPSRRILAKIPRYDKVAAGAVVAIDIGLPTLRAKCPHFNQWLIRLEQMGP